MRSPSRSGWIGAGIVAAVVLLALAVPVWPSALGGSTTYVVNRGESMKPAFGNGDLAVLRPAGNYRVGDVAAYRNTALGRVVVHRIVAIDAASFTFKGDANTFLDPQRVGRSDIVGKPSVRLPKVGAGLIWLTHPFNTVLLVLFIALLAWNRSRLLALVRGMEIAQPAPGAPPVAALRLDQDRVVRIRDMSFPHELAVADVVDPTGLMRLAEHYDRPVLYDEAESLLFVVETSMLFRCSIAVSMAPPAPVLSVVTSPEEPIAPSPVTVLPTSKPSATPVTKPAAERDAAPDRSEDRAKRHRWPAQPLTYGRRKPSPLGRDWRYDLTV